MTKSKRFKPIAKLAASREQEAAKVLGKSQQVLTAQELRLAELKTYRSEYVESYMSAGGKGISVDQMRNYQVFLVNLDKAISQQEILVNNTTNEVGKDKTQWFETLSRKKVMNKVVDKFKHEELRSASKSEQREMDDRVTRNDKSFKK